MSSVCQDLSGTMSNLICEKKWKFPRESSHDLSLQQDDVFNLWSAQSHFVGCYSLARQSALFKLEL